MPKVPLVLSLPMPYEASLKSVVLGFIVKSVCPDYANRCAMRF